MYWYRSRWYDPAIGRFMQPDTLVPGPGNPQALNRYAYVLNNPVRYRDPTGHCVAPGIGIYPPCLDMMARLAQQAQALAIHYGPQVAQFVMLYGDKVPVVGDYIVQMARQADGRLQQAGQGGNTAGPGGLDPNDPLFRKLIEQTGEPDVIKAIAKASTQGPAAEGARKGITVLGRYPAYVNKANELHANYLNFVEGTWEKLSDAQRWAVNKQFLDDAIARGDTFRLASTLREAESGTYFRRELDYLLSLGYEVVGDVLIKVK